MPERGRLSTEPLWYPSPERVAGARITHFTRWIQDRHLIAAENYSALYDWSIRDRQAFWPAVAEFCGVLGDGLAPASAADVVVGADRMAPPDALLGPRWFPSARLSYAENLLAGDDQSLAIIFRNERGERSALTRSALRASVAAVAGGLRDSGVRAGDRVAGWLPNIPETVVAMLAASSLGAVWSSCSPDFGARAVLDRFGQISPRVLFCADGYVYAGREHDCLERAARLADDIPGIERVVVVPYREERPRLAGIRGAVAWRDFAAGSAPLRFARFPFDHPLAILYSSGTTGLPKCMVHGAGGTLLQHRKEHVLHTDIRPGDRVLYVTTCGWMMWNWLVSALASSATIVLYDGAPFAPAAHSLWDIVAGERVTAFGTSARYLALSQKEGVAPRRTHDLSSLRTILSTGSPLAPHSYDYIYQDVSPDVHLANIAGGTDLISCWVLGNPTLPVYRGEIQVRGLGMAVEVWDAAGRPQVGQQGELVCTRPFPSMPVSFWNDPEGAAYRESYFARWPGVWRHGDWCELTSRGGMVIYGRSDATLNPGGVRIGTAEIYRQVEQVTDVMESLAVSQETEGGDVRIVLFVRLRTPGRMDEALERRIRSTIREGASPRHVPAVIVEVADLPRTISGKLSEIAVRERIHGRPVTNVDALANAASLEELDTPRVRNKLATPSTRRPGPGTA